MVCAGGRSGTGDWTAGGCSGVRLFLLLLLLTTWPSERTSGESASLSDIHEDDSAGGNSSFGAAFSESAAAASLLLLLLLLQLLPDGQYSRHARRAAAAGWANDLVLARWREHRGRIPCLWSAASVSALQRGVGRASSATSVVCGSGCMAGCPSPSRLPDTLSSACWFFEGRGRGAGRVKREEGGSQDLAAHCEGR